MELDDAYSLISSAIDSGHAANAYLVVGDVFRGEHLADRIIHKLLPDGWRNVSDDANVVIGSMHPDVSYLRPSGKIRIFPIAEMHDMLDKMSTSSGNGGWKFGVIVGADRFGVPGYHHAANAFLKLLEEPPAKTMFLLLTDAPDMILPTIVSRTQRVDLRLSSGLLDESDRTDIAEIFESSGIKGTFAKSQAAKQLAELYDELKDRVEEEEGDVSAMRKAFYKTITHYVRQWMIDDKLPRYQVFHDLNAIEEAYLQSSRSMSADAVLSYMCDRMFFPA